MNNYNIVFNDGSELECLSISGEHRQIKGLSRDCLIFNFDVNNANMDEIFTKFTNENIMCNFSVKRESTNEKYIYSDYVIFDGMFVEEKTALNESNNSPKETIMVLSVTVGQMSYSEKLAKEQNEQLDSMSEVIADILGGAL